MRMRNSKQIKKQQVFVQVYLKRKFGRILQMEGESDKNLFREAFKCKLPSVLDYLKLFDNATS